MFDEASIDAMIQAAALACLVASIFSSGHTRTYFALIAILNAGLAGMFT